MLCHSDAHNLSDPVHNLTQVTAIAVDAALLNKLPDSYVIFNI